MGADSPYVFFFSAGTPSLSFSEVIIIGMLVPEEEENCLCHLLRVIRLVGTRASRMCWVGYTR